MNGGMYENYSQQLHQAIIIFPILHKEYNREPVVWCWHIRNIHVLLVNTILNWISQIFFNNNNKKHINHSNFFIQNKKLNPFIGWEGVLQESKILLKLLVTFLIYDLPTLCQFYYCFLKAEEKCLFFLNMQCVTKCKYWSTFYSNTGFLFELINTMLKSVGHYNSISIYK